MIIWINGAFGSGKTATAFELHRRLENSFVYDPENVGYFIRKNAPQNFSKGDFQDILLWREMNYKFLKLISGEYDGIIIVPMTLVSPDYYAEIIDKLIGDGIEVKHFILYADRATILKRLKSRSPFGLRSESFAVNSIDRCIYSFDNHIKDVKIITDDKKIDEVVDEIAQKSDIKLTADNRSGIKKIFDRVGTFINHIR